MVTHLTNEPAAAPEGRRYRGGDNESFYWSSVTQRAMSTRSDEDDYPKLEQCAERGSTSARGKLSPRRRILEMMQKQAKPFFASLEKLCHHTLNPHQPHGARGNIAALLLGRDTPSRQRSAALGGGRAPRGCRDSCGFGLSAVQAHACSARTGIPPATSEAPS